MKAEQSNQFYEALAQVWAVGLCIREGRVLMLHDWSFRGQSLDILTCHLIQEHS
jgi:hypothetical protein